MKLHELKSKKQIKPKKRVGRGGKRGTTSGRGTKGQKSRSGRRIRKSERDLILRLPKKRGFRNKIKSPKPITLNLEKISAKLKDVKVVDRATLEQFNLIPSGYRGVIKVLGNGNATPGSSFKGIKISESAKMKIEKAGGHIS
ncbi:MAG: 50S ribosomal protein L15 [Patescibacteria group bacterium]